MADNISVRDSVEKQQSVYEQPAEGGGDDKFELPDPAIQKSKSYFDI